MAAGDLTDLAACKADLDLSGTVRDAVVQSAITAASRAITVHCQREFVPTAAATRTFAWAGGTLDLAPYDLRAVTSITVGTDDPASQQVLAATDYRLRPKPAADGVYQTIDLGTAYVDWPGRTFGDREVQIVGDWGFAAVPADVAHWTILTVATWLRQKFAPFVEDTQESLIPEPANLPWSVKAGLRHYRRIQAS